MQTWISHKSSCRHGGHASPPASTPQFCWYWGRGLESGDCFAALPVPVLVVHTDMWAGDMGRDAGNGVGPQHISVEMWGACACPETSSR